VRDDAADEGYVQHSRQIHVQYGHVGFFSQNHFQRGLALVGLADKLKARVRLDSLPQPLPEQWMIIHDHDASFRRLRHDEVITNSPKKTSGQCAEEKVRALSQMRLPGALL
jgi:hypothetical protein